MFDWMDEEEDLTRADLSPRLFVERLGYTRWEQVIKHIEEEIEKRGFESTYWWDNDLNGPVNRVTAQQCFEDLVQQRSTSNKLPDVSE